MCIRDRSKFMLWLRSKVSRWFRAIDTYDLIDTHHRLSFLRCDFGQRFNERIRGKLVGTEQLLERFNLMLVHYFKPDLFGFALRFLQFLFQRGDLAPQFSWIVGLWLVRLCL